MRLIKSSGCFARWSRCQSAWEAAWGVPWIAWRIGSGSVRHTAF